MNFLNTYCSFNGKTEKFSPFFFFIVVLFNNPVKAQDTLHNKQKEIIAYSIAGTAVAGATVFLITQDLTIQRFYKSHESRAIDLSSKYFFSPLGNGLISLPVLGIFYGIGSIKKDDRARLTAIQGVEAYLVAGITTGVIKQITHRHRPYQDEPPDPLQWDGPIASINFNSFPSGHSAAIFAIATVIAGQYQETIWVPIVCYSVAGVTAAYRLGVNKHWSSDVFFGSAVGIASGIFILKADPLSHFHLIPFTSSGPGLTVLFSFK